MPVEQYELCDVRSRYEILTKRVEALEKARLGGRLIWPRL
jgi:hypothetical protein